jgi:hypothetical protein
MINDIFFQKGSVFLLNKMLISSFYVNKLSQPSVYFITTACILSILVITPGFFELFPFRIDASLGK